ncbi:MAG: hypothetical protein IKY83_11565 [Proteobacteria bacterium]|nr:hypothetical protein [Pseudomonadota bacterium]
MAKKLTHLARFSNRDQRDNAPIRHLVFRTWSEAKAYLAHEMIDLPAEADGIETLRLLRDRFAGTYTALLDPVFDETVQQGRSFDTLEQLCRLGDKMLEFDMTLIRIYRADNKVILTIIDDSEASQAFIARCRVCKKPFFLPLAISSKVYSPTNIIQYPLQPMQIIAPDDQFFKLDNYLVVIRCEADRFDPRPVYVAKAYDLRYWPLTPASTTLTYDGSDLMPFCLKIQTAWGEDSVYYGSPDALRSNREWHRSPRPQTEAFTSPCEEEDSFDDIVHLPALSGNPVQDIPYICHAKPCFSLDGRIYYCYYNDPNAETSIVKDIRYPQSARTLIEYDPQHKTWRMLEIPFANSIDASYLTVYRHTWIVIWPDIWQYHNNHGYAIMFWNPKTNELLYMSKRDIGRIDIDHILSIDHGDLLLILKDGRICRFEGDIISWLRSEKREIRLSPWQNEIRRDYDGFRDTPLRYRHAEIDDRMNITFENGQTLDIESCEAQIYHRTHRYHRRGRI